MRYYTLTPVAPASTPTKAVSAMRLGRVTIPRELDRSELVQRIDATRLMLAEQDRWAAPIDDLVRRTLSNDLAARLPQSAAGAHDSTRTLSIDIDDFLADASCNVTLRATWSLAEPNVATIQKTEQITVAVNGACATSALPSTMSRALGELSDRIASALPHE
jgi:uncharacterized lipoprotein YmbA